MRYLPSAYCFYVVDTSNDHANMAYSNQCGSVSYIMAVRVVGT